jgi:acetyltransferase-like isoleucine patch superfamily enzyme
MLRKLLSLSLAWQRPLWRAYARMRRATVHPSVVMNGRPLVRCVRGGKLEIGKRVKINTRLSSNPVIGRQRTTLMVVAPGALMRIGEGVGISGACLCAAQSLTIGENTIIGADAMITDTDFHAPLPDGRWSNDAAGASKPVVIGKGCFIGARAIILKGVILGDGAVVAAGAMVTRNVPAEHLAIGNPAVVKPLDERWKHKAPT